MIYQGSFNVSEIFHTIQGEATFTGTPSLFVRLQFCDVGCPFCDTKYTWNLNESDREEGLTNTNGKWKRYTEEQLIHYLFDYIEINELAKPHIVFTGGEPCAYDLTSITTILNRQGFSTQIETSGLYAIRCSHDTFVTVSPKIDMPSGKQIITESLWRANEIKMPVGKQTDILKLNRLLEEHRVGKKTVWLQPLSRSPKSTALCIDACHLYGYRLSIQTHHIIGLP